MITQKKHLTKFGIAKVNSAKPIGALIRWVNIMS